LGWKRRAGRGYGLEEEGWKRIWNILFGQRCHDDLPTLSPAILLYKLQVSAGVSYQ
jgi:hypothetical protein